MRLGAAFALVVAACAIDPQTDREIGQDVSETEQAATVCGVGPTVKGIDVSIYQGTIDWAKVKASGVEYAFVRISDGLNSIDSKFAQNWAGTKANGVLRGAYQFFRPNQSATEQADLFLSKLGTLGPNDLNPVIDVEAADGASATKIANGVRTWVERVKAATGRTPIIYTGFYFWRDSVGNADPGDSPLWHAQYSSASCPNIATAWPTWALWQYSSTGSVPGISGNVDMNRFNGTRADLVAQLSGPAIPCGSIARDGGTIDDKDACFTPGGPLQYIRQATDAGEGGGLRWTHATEDTTEANSGQWNLNIEEPGVYRVEVSTPAPYAQSKQANYVVKANGETHEILVDQTVSDGWQSLGEIAFAAGGEQFVHLGDNTGEPLADNIQIAFDAVRLTRVERSDPTNPDPTMPGDDEQPELVTDSGCSAGGSSSSASLVFALLLGGVIRRRRR